MVPVACGEGPLEVSIMVNKDEGWSEYKMGVPSRLEVISENRWMSGVFKSRTCCNEREKERRERDRERVYEYDVV